MRSRGAGSSHENKEQHSLYSEDGWIESPYERQTGTASADGDEHDDKRHNDPLTLHRLKGKSAAVPGRPRRKVVKGNNNQRNNNKHTSWLFVSPQWWNRYFGWWPTATTTWFQNDNSKLVLAVLLWYSLGIISISTSKLLLTTSKVAPNHPRYYHHVGGVPPLFLTLQQFLLGSTFLRFLLSIKFLNSPGLQPWSVLHSLGSGSGDGHHSGGDKRRPLKRNHPNNSTTQSSSSTTLATLSHLVHARHTRYLLCSGTFFSMGFLATNYGFSGSSAAFVETIKAAEPITSASLVVLWKLEVISQSEWWSLACIVAGVLLSTVGNQSSTTATSSSTATSTTTTTSAFTTLAASFASCVIVMASNLLFSFRGLYQKLLRAEHIPVQVLDDLNLQFRFQQLGVWILMIPVLVCNGPGILRHVYMVTTTPKVGLLASGILMRYIGLALLNGLAFTSYK